MEKILIIEIGPGRTQRLCFEKLPDGRVEVKLVNSDSTTDEFATIPRDRRAEIADFLAKG
jgi:hypothetical protein